MKPKSFDIPNALVWEAYQHVKANGGAPGVDHETIEKFEERFGESFTSFGIGCAPAAISRRR
ncbi:hypothetical protein SS37A_37230 (plasmid) [Methylocystis iwaonis]|uniref:Reverse transcriptase n=1 Tax=Methylocystis iwaonis TaxID=2885079 RepID=A0ABN6VKA6_9HYPH|nr:hypothetical protein SS37A_37230 [Methylocystis iwaonis]